MGSSIIISSLLITASAWIVTLCVYRANYHPLAKYPGPLLAKFSDIFAAWHAFRGDIHLVMTNCHDDYGKFVRFGPNKLLVNSSTAFDDINSSPNVKKSQGWKLLTPVPGQYNILSAVHKPLHRFKRKVLSRGFSEEAWRTFEPTLIGHVDSFLQVLGGPLLAAEWSLPRNMTPHINFLTYDIMGEYGFGRSFDMQLDARNRWLPRLMRLNQIRTGSYMQCPWLEKLKLEIFYPKIIWMRDKLFRLTAEYARLRLSDDRRSKSDIFSAIAEGEDHQTGRTFTNDELWSEATALIAAGSETVAVCIAALLFYTSMYPQCFERLQSEVRHTFKTSMEIKHGLALTDCKYLSACISETLRISPPVASAPWREVEEPGILVDGESVPQGIEIGTSIYTLHHDEESFDSPDVFRPERWLDAVSEGELKAFGVGVHRCLGHSFALKEISIVMAKIIWQYDYRRADGPLARVGGGNRFANRGRHRFQEYQLWEHITCSGKGPYLQFRAANADR